jgi:hypothetical protein
LRPTKTLLRLGPFGCGKQVPIDQFIDVHGMRNRPNG